MSQEIMTAAHIVISVNSLSFLVAAVCISFVAIRIVSGVTIKKALRRIAELEKEIHDAEEQIRCSYETAEPGPNNDGFPSRLSFYIHEIWKRDVKKEVAK